MNIAYRLSRLSKFDRIIREDRIEIFGGDSRDLKFPTSIIVVIVVVLTPVRVLRLLSVPPHKLCLTLHPLTLVQVPKVSIVVQEIKEDW